MIKMIKILKSVYSYIVNHFLGILIRQSPLVDIAYPIFHPTPCMRWRSKVWIIRGSQNVSLIAPAGVLFYALIGEIKSFSTIFMIAKPGMIFLDVGAGVGSYAIPLAKKGIKIYAIEPDALSIALLRMNAYINNVVDKVSTMQMLVSQTTGKVNYCYQHLLKSCISHVKKVLVKSKPLDDIIQELKIKPDIIKIDVDGGEIDVIKSGISTIKNAKYILIETPSRTFHEVNIWMKKMGKEVFLIERMYSNNIGILRLPIQTPSFMVLYIDKSILNL